MNRARRASAFRRLLFRFRSMERTARLSTSNSLSTVNYVAVISPNWWGKFRDQFLKHGDHFWSTAYPHRAIWSAVTGFRRQEMLGKQLQTTFSYRDELLIADTMQAAYRSHNAIKAKKYSNKSQWSLSLQAGPPPIVWRQGQNIDFMRIC